MNVLDAIGQQIGPILTAAAMKYAIPVLLLLTCAKAESNLTPVDNRVNGLADTSVGPYQQTCRYAPIGDHTASPANLAFCAQAFSDWTFATDVAATNLAGKYRIAIADGYEGDDAILEALSGYNSGSNQPTGDWWWSSEQHANYVAALAWSHAQLGE